MACGDEDFLSEAQPTIASGPEDRASGVEENPITAGDLDAPSDEAAATTQWSPSDLDDVSPPPSNPRTTRKYGIAPPTAGAQTTPRREPAHIASSAVGSAPQARRTERYVAAGPDDDEPLRQTDRYPAADPDDDEQRRRTNRYAAENPRPHATPLAAGGQPPAASREGPRIWQDEGGAAGKPVRPLELPLKPPAASMHFARVGRSPDSSEPGVARSSKTEDIRIIRQGLGLASQTEQRAIAPPVAATRNRAWSSQGRRAAAAIAWLVLVSAVIAGSISAGLEIRERRLARELIEARDMAKERSARLDFDELVAADAIYERISGFDKAPNVGAERARVRAVLAFEHRYGLSEAREAVEGLPPTGEAAQVARAFLALAERRDADADRYAKGIGDPAVAAYVAGHAALLRGDRAAAHASFEASLVLDPTPQPLLVKAALARRAGRLDDAASALARAMQLESDAIAWRIEAARLAAARGDEPASLESMARELEAKLAAHASPRQRREATLARAELALAYGDRRESLHWLSELDASEGWTPQLAEEAAELALALGAPELERAFTARR